MKNILILISILLLSFCFSYSQNVGIGSLTPATKLVVLGTADTASIPGKQSSGILRVTTSNAQGLDFGKLALYPYTNWIQAGAFGTRTDPVSFQPMGGNLGIGTLYPNSAAILELNDTARGFLPPRMTSVQRDIIANPPLGLVIFNATSNALESYNGASWDAYVNENPLHKVGESYGGGIVFYVTPNGVHGLVVETIGQADNGINWYDAHDTISNPASHSIAGKNFTDWRLPTKYELNLLYSEYKFFTYLSGKYWSSTESFDNNYTDTRFAYTRNLSVNYESYENAPKSVQVISVRSF